MCRLSVKMTDYDNRKDYDPRNNNSPAHLLGNGHRRLFLHLAVIAGRLEQKTRICLRAAREDIEMPDTSGIE